MHRSTASRLAATLATAGYLEPAGEQGRYRLAAKLSVLGEVAAAGNDLRDAALPPCATWCRSSARRAISASSRGPRRSRSRSSTAGRRSGCTHGWASGPRRTAARSARRCSPGSPPADFAARYPDPELPARTPATITSRDELEKCLAEVRERGYADDREELEPHLCCVAAPVFGRDGAVVASVSVSGTASRLRDPAAMAAVAAEVRATARQVSTRLGAP